ncbi:2-polyprenyl-6-methoxyphenol hydroxylase-like FAD-dependent oxidoreductase [Luteibacter rhizovicinus]|uniref:2-polyprenyl-6-methoxyphenol hydroxylase-like FAD-dependent oxidoreductase n=1 Tax=Luteibacter rhizovicinus TaxID=242606 RepID=A0A4R3YPD8_9GAMM|nr:FAD binding domain-containing protein [Luteibacter rhizovicinus]TCV93438.1 2-polyprenyl-6-methoxyphenol hydroxylase-like FAD-dependent oxidoreductase [Luteibacter rhizovicinus]
MALRIGIVGGSMGGLFAAALLRADGHDVRIFERSGSGLEGRGAGLVGQREVFAILRLVGCEHVSKVGVLARERITLDRTGSIAHRDATPQMQISWDYLYRAFRDRVPADAYRTDTRVTGVENGTSGAALVFATGEREAFDLVIGADGVGSVVRDAMGTADHLSRYAGYVAWRGLLPETQLPADAADTLLERFAFYHMHGSHILGYLVAGPHGEMDVGRRRYNWVWYRQAATKDGLDRWLTDATGKLHRFSLAPGDIAAPVHAELLADAEALLPHPFALAVAAEPRPFVQAIFDYETPRMTKDRVALLGDAAFVVRPHTAMGVAKAAGDAMALATALREFPIETALAVYDKDRSVVGRRIAAYGRELGAPLTPQEMGNDRQ